LLWSDPDPNWKKRTAGWGFFYLDEELDVGANVDEIQVGVEAEDVDAAAGAPRVEDDGVLLRARGAGQGADLPGGGVGGGRARHEEEHEGDERERREDDEQDAAVAVEAVGERVLAAVGQRGVAAHPGGVAGEEEVWGGWGAVAHAAGGGRRRLGALLRRHTGIQRSPRASVADLLLPRAKRGLTSAGGIAGRKCKLCASGSAASEALLLLLPPGSGKEKAVLFLYLTDLIRSQHCEFGRFGAVGPSMPPLLSSSLARTPRPSAAVRLAENGTARRVQTTPLTGWVQSDAKCYAFHGYSVAC
jgi:hypothetical protein